MSIPFHVLLRQKLRGLAVLRRHLGAWGALSVGLEVERLMGEGRPFGDSPEDELDPDESWCRAQIAPAIVLYGILQERDADRAMEWTRSVVLESASIWMRHALGDLSIARWRGLDEAGRRALLRARTSQFRNMELADVEVDEAAAFFRVTLCRFPKMCEQAGVPELAPVFCAVDAHFFGGVERSIALDRPETLATGGGSCPFSLRWVDDPGA